MHPVSFSEGYLRSPDRTNRDGASCLSVDPDGRGKSAADVVRFHVKNIAVLGVAREIDQMEAVVSDGNLGLNAVVRNGQNSDRLVVYRGRAERRRRCRADQKPPSRGVKPGSIPCHGSILAPPGVRCPWWSLRLHFEIGGADDGIGSGGMRGGHFRSEERR